MLIFLVCKSVCAVWVMICEFAGRTIYTVDPTTFFLRSKPDTGFYRVLDLGASVEEIYYTWHAFHAKNTYCILKPTINTKVRRVKTHWLSSSYATNKIHPRGQVTMQGGSRYFEKGGEGINPEKKINWTFSL